MSEVGERNALGLAKAERYRILTEYRTIAMVGLSTNYYNASSFAAIYLDGGLEPARSFIERHFEDYLADGQANRADAKTTLQEWAQARGLEPPAYILVERTGPDHAPEFTIRVDLAGFDPLEAIGPSKKIAEHRVAEQFLVRQKVWKERK